MIHLELDDLLHIAARVVDDVELGERRTPRVCACSSRATAFGADAYPTIDKAGALLHSLALNHGLVDGNKRLALAGTIAFLGMNGWRLTLTNDEAYDLVIDVIQGGLEDVAAIAARLAEGTEPRVTPAGGCAEKVGRTPSAGRLISPAGTSVSRTPAATAEPMTPATFGPSRA